MNERNDQLKGLIQDGHIDQAIGVVQSTRNYLEGESFVFTVLDEEKSTPELVETVLKAFLDTRENRYDMHGRWVHSLSHFTRILWERRMDSWIKKFNEVSFKGAKELDDSGCCERLVRDFCKYAKFNDDPADFALTLENLSWMDWKHATYSKARIEAGRFESEEAFLQWKLKRPEMHIAFDQDAQINLVNIKEIRSLVQKLHELGADTSEFDGLEKDLLTKQLGELEAKLLVTTEDWQRGRLEKGIRKTREALA